MYKNCPSLVVRCCKLCVGCAGGGGGQHPVSGGVFPVPPAVGALMQLLPPPWSFNGPFVGVDLIMDKFREIRFPDRGTHSLHALSGEIYCPLFAIIETQCYAFRAQGG